MDVFYEKGKDVYDKRHGRLCTIQAWRLCTIKTWTSMYNTGMDVYVQ
jgi:hypothetical protein